MNKKIIYGLLGGLTSLSIVGVILFFVLKKEIYLSHENLIMYTGYTREVSLENYDGVCEWKASDQEIVNVSDGNIEAVKPGKTQVICVTEDGKQYTCQIQVFETVSNEYHKKATEEIKWLELLQLSDGSFSCYELEENMPARVNPYFGSYVALAILRNDHENVKSKRIESFIEWYFSHMNMEKDINDSVGTVYDYKVIVENGVVTQENCSYDYDSADSYAAIFLMLLEEYLEKYDGKAILYDEKDKIDTLVDLLLTLQKDNYTESKNGSDTKYLMNNMEVYQGLKSARNIYEILWLEDIRYEKLKTAVKGFENNFEKLWKSGSYYYPVLDGENESFYGEEMDWKMLYVYALPQLFPVMFDIVEADDKFVQNVYSDFCKNWNWTEMEFGDESEANQTWSLVVYAAMKMEDYNRVDDYIEHYSENIVDRGFPYYSGDSVWLALTCEEAFAYYAAKESQGELIPRYENELN